MNCNYLSFLQNNCPLFTWEVIVQSISPKLKEILTSCSLWLIEVGRSAELKKHNALLFTELLPNIITHEMSACGTWLLLEG